MNKDEFFEWLFDGVDSDVFAMLGFLSLFTPEARKAAINLALSNEDAQEVIKMYQDSELDSIQEKVNFPIEEVFKKEIIGD